MKSLRIVLSAGLVLATFAAQASTPAPVGEPTREAKTAFLKKCFRDRTPAACTAPPEARKKTQVP